MEFIFLSTFAEALVSALLEDIRKRRNNFGIIKGFKNNKVGVLG